MDIDTLARMIAEKVLAELHSAQKPHGGNTRVLVFAKESHELTVSLQQTLGTGCALDYFRPDFSTKGYARYIIPHLCCPNMAALALGQSTSSMTRAVLDLLLTGHEVEVLEYEYQRYQATAPDSLYRLYEEYAATLRAYGLVPLNRHANSIARSRERLITEKIVKDTAREGYAGLVVPADAIVTDLAKESALALKFQLTRAQKEG